MAGEKHPGEGHRGRLRERFLQFGLDKFTDEEVLELLLTLATPRKDCKQQARRLMQGLGSLRSVLDAQPEVLARYQGIGPKNILGIKLAPAVAQRYLADRLLHMGRYQGNSWAVNFLKMSMRSLTREVFRVMLLDADYRVRSVEDVAQGALTEARAHPREVAALALGAKAAALVCTHNHPGGKASPSLEDRELTRRLYHVLRPMEIELLDHIIVGEDDIYSFAQAGDIQALAKEHQTLNL